ncbi:MAG: cytochrome c [Deltaproteobacteria bacterium]|nr:cytochrome c [Deltaproteobacteria bacterium]
MKIFSIAAFGFFVVSITAVAAPAPKPPKSTPQLIEKGTAAYKANCEVCHGPAGDGMGPAGQALNPKPRNFTEPFKAGKKPEQVFKTISEGLPNTAMVGFAQIPEEDRWGLVYYVLSFDKAAAKKKK